MTVRSLPFGKMVLTFSSKIRLTKGLWRWKEDSDTFNLVGLGTENTLYSRSYDRLKLTLVKSNTKTRLIEMFSLQLSIKCLL